MYRGLKKRKTFEECVQDLQHFDKLIKYPNRKATRIKECMDMLNLNIYSTVNFVDEQTKQIFHDKAAQAELLKLERKQHKQILMKKAFKLI